jgi:hypothetical protein
MHTSFGDSPKTFDKSKSLRDCVDFFLELNLQAVALKNLPGLICANLMKPCVDESSKVCDFTFEFTHLTYFTKHSFRGRDPLWELNIETCGLRFSKNRHDFSLIFETIQKIQSLRDVASRKLKKLYFFF